MNPKCPPLKSYSYSPLTSIGGRGSWILLGMVDAW
jgi:hypothetical protein